MGYTHYHSFQRDFGQGEWYAIMEDCKRIFKLCEFLEIDLREDFYKDKQPIIGFNYIQFNGYMEQGCESFFIHRYRCNNRSFCKTNREPYDMAVGLCLLRIKAIAPEVITISSDGCWDAEDEWVPIRRVYEGFFNEKPLDTSLGMTWTWDSMS